jgi:ATP-dependent RNA circularization protein (DNA/RNA ligase family)
MSEYHKIETLYERDLATFKVKPEILKNPVYGIIKSWRWTEKIDGTNIRVMWQDGKLTFGGKTDNAQIHADLIRYLYETFDVELMRSIFPDANVVLYGEGYGAGIQKGGDLSPTKKFILFDVRVGEWWLSHENVADVAQRLGIDMVPDFGEMTLKDATALVHAGFQSKLNGGAAKAEGLVGRPLEALYDKKFSRLIVKLKTRDF